MFRVLENTASLEYSPSGECFTTSNLFVHCHDVILHNRSLKAFTADRASQVLVFSAYVVMSKAHI